MSNRRGMALITLLASIAILAIALAGAASVFVSASRLTKHAACVTTASNCAESQMERLRSQSFGSIRTTSVNAGLPKLPGARCDVSVTTPEPGLKEITVSCSWTEGKRPYTVRLSTLRSGGQRR